jgi:hypothetical protein
MDDIHSCSYFCDRPACIKAQRDKLREILYEREWQGLTDEEKSVIRSSVAYSQFMTVVEYAEKVQDATEAKLKEKNYDARI